MNYVNSLMRVFKDRNAERRFFDLYDKLSPEAQKMMGQLVRDLAEQKMNGAGDELFVIRADVSQTINRLRNECA